MSFLFINKTLRLNNLKTRTAMNAKISIFVICVEAIIYLSLHNFHDCTFKHTDFNLSYRLIMDLSSQRATFVLFYLKTLFFSRFWTPGYLYFLKNSFPLFREKSHCNFSPKVQQKLRFFIETLKRFLNKTFACDCFLILIPLNLTVSNNWCNTWKCLTVKLNFLIFPFIYIRVWLTLIKRSTLSPKIINPFLPLNNILDCM